MKYQQDLYTDGNIVYHSLLSKGTPNDWEESQPFLKFSFTTFPSVRSGSHSVRFLEIIPFSQLLYLPSWTFNNHFSTKLDRFCKLDCHKSYLPVPWHLLTLFLGKIGINSTREASDAFLLFYTQNIFWLTINNNLKYVCHSPRNVHSLWTGLTILYQNRLSER